MPSVDNQLTQSEFAPPAENQPMETEKPFSLTRRQLILIVVGGLTLLLIFGLGVRAGEKRALREQLELEAQPTPTNIQPSPTPLLITPTPTQPTSSAVEEQPIKEGEETVNRKGPSSVDTCSKDTDCIKCYFPAVPCEAGNCVNGICVWPTSPPRPKK